MKLNKKQKEILVDNMFEPEDLGWLEMNFGALKEQDLEIRKANYGWYEVYANGKILTEVNFASYPEVLEQIKLLGE